MTRTGLPKAFSKLNRVQPLPRFFGSVRMRPFLTGAGKPTETTSLLPVVELTVKHGVKLAWSKAGTGTEFAPSLARDHGLDVGAADIDDQNLFHARLRWSRFALIGISFTPLMACNSAAALRAWRERSRKCNCACDRAAPSTGCSRT